MIMYCKPLIPSEGHEHVITVKCGLVLSLIIAAVSFKIEPRCEKTVFGVSDQARHKPGCTATEDALGLEISDLESRGIVLSV